MIFKNNLQFVLSLLLLILPIVSNANCFSSGSTEQNLGSFPSTEIQTQLINATISSSFQCDPPLVGLVTSNEIDVTLVQSAFALTNSNGDSIPYQLFADSNRTDNFNIGETKSYGPFSDLISLLGLFSSFDGAIPIYLTLGTANPSAGQYSDTAIFQWDWQYCSGIGVTPLICLGYETGTETIAITINLEVTGDCGMGVNIVDLGQITYLGSSNQAVMNVSVRCTKDLTYQLYVDGGDYFDGTYRNLNNSGERIAYKIEDPNGVNPIGPTVLNNFTGVGNGGLQAIDLPVSTIIVDEFPQAGNYMDNVRVITVY